MTNPASIRKAAILVSLLDARSADAILQPMPDELAAKVRHAVMELDEVSLQEQDDVLAEFFGRGRDDRRDAGGVELQLGLENSESIDVQSTGIERDEIDAATVPSLTFLADVPAALLADMLPRERPQTVAVVV